MIEQRHARLQDERSANPLDIEEAVIHANRQRDKTPETIMREGRELKRIETAKAKARQQKAGKTHGKGQTEQVKEPVTEPIGQARDLAAAQLGISGPTLDAGIAVVEAIEEAEGEVDTAKAEDLRQTLNTKGVKPAKRQADGEPEPTKPPKKRKPAPDPDPAEDDDDEAEAEERSRSRVGVDRTDRKGIGYGHI